MRSSYHEQLGRRHSENSPPRLILVNPARGCKLPKLEKREMKILPEEKIKTYLMEADKHGLLAPFYLELTTGLRRGELPALLWTNLDVENRTISITKQVKRIKGELVVSQPKTQNSVRVLPVSQQAVDPDGGGAQETSGQIRICSRYPRQAGCLPRTPTGTPMRRF